MLGVVMLRVFMLSVIMLSVVMLNVMAPIYDMVEMDQQRLLWLNNKQQYGRNIYHIQGMLKGEVSLYC